MSPASEHSEAVTIEQVQGAVDHIRDDATLVDLRHCLELIVRAGAEDEQPEGGPTAVGDPLPNPRMQAGIKQLIALVADAGLLGSIMGFIRGQENDLRGRALLNRRVAWSEADFKAGRIFTQEQVEQHFHHKRGR